jgi:hypothetical protein
VRPTRGLAYPICLAVLLFCPVACSRKATSGPIIDRYRLATCVAPLTAPKRITPLTREWDAVISLRDGASVTVFGYQAVGGSIELRYSPSGVHEVAASSGDYVYPTDVRVSADDRVLYVKTSGLGAGIWQETWLFEYDLADRKQLGRVQVDPSVLPPECARARPNTQRGSDGAAEQGDEADER